MYFTVKVLVYVLRLYKVNNKIHLKHREILKSMECSALRNSISTYHRVKLISQITHVRGRNYDVMAILQRHACSQ